MILIQQLTMFKTTDTFCCPFGPREHVSTEVTECVTRNIQFNVTRVFKQLLSIQAGTRRCTLI